MKKLQMFLLAVLLFCCVAGPAAAQNKIVSKTSEGLLEESTYSIIPFAFYNKLLQFAVGGAVSAQWVLQDQLFGQLSVIGSSNGSFFAIFKVEDCENAVMPMLDGLSGWVRYLLKPPLSSSNRFKPPPRVPTQSTPARS